MVAYKSVIHIYDTKHNNDIVFEGDIDGVCDYFDMERHNVYQYVNNGNLYKYRYKFVRVGRKRPMLEIDEESERQLCEDYKNGVRISQLVKKYGLTYFSTDTVLIRNGLKEPRLGVEIRENYKPVAKIDKGKVVALLKAGWSIEKVAEEFITTRENIIEVVKELRKEGKI